MVVGSLCVCVQVAVVTNSGYEVSWESSCSTLQPTCNITVRMYVCKWELPLSAWLVVVGLRLD